LRSAAFTCQGLSLVIVCVLVYPSAVSRLSRPFLSDRCFFVTARLLKRRAKLGRADFRLLALALNRGRAMHPFLLTAWVFLPDHWHAICAPAHPLTISRAITSIKTSSTVLINWRYKASGELWQSRFFDRALRTVKEYNDKVEYIHLNPVKAGLVQGINDWPWSSVNEYSGISAAEQERRCGLMIDRVNMPPDRKTRVRAELISAANAWATG
jgi:putative transposase